jgi:hypothetical protein
MNKILLDRIDNEIDTIKCSEKALSTLDIICLVDKKKT